MTFPREDLIRMAGKFELRSQGDGRTMVGYPIVFNQATEVDSWEGNFIERVAPGAVTKTIRERGKQIQVLFNHGFDPQIGMKPLGVPSVMREDKTGLYTETPLANTSYNADLVELLHSGAISGMSFRFQVVKEEVNEEPGLSPDNPKGLPERLVTELRLYEYGPCTFPAYEAAEAGLRSRWPELDDEKKSRIAQVLGLESREAPLHGDPGEAGENPPDEGDEPEEEESDTAERSAITSQDRRQRIAEIRGVLVPK